MYGVWCHNIIQIIFAFWWIYPRFVKPGMDGQVFSDDRQYLYVAHNEANEIYQFESSGTFESMTLANTINFIYRYPNRHLQQ